MKDNNEEARKAFGKMITNEVIRKLQEQANRYRESLTNIEFNKVQKQFEEAKKAFENFDKESFQEKIKKFREYQISKDIEKLLY